MSKCQIDYNIESYKISKYIAFNVLFKKKKRVNFFLSVIPFSERKTAIVPSSRVITMDVWVSQNIKVVIYKSVDVLKSGNVSMYKAVLK